jgi:predicted DNA-binding antitoxin AbrB/MazE fold protein
MTQLIQAIFENGAFRPLEPVQLNEHARVLLTVDTPTASGANDATALERQREALARLRAEMDALPDNAPRDGLGGADHDAILYGGRT